MLAEPWQIRTRVFDGPLDLLLYLIKRDGIDVREVSVAAITDSYLEYLDHLREIQLDLAGDYLVMAATLCHLKSLEILPRPPTLLEEEEEDPREELTRRLLEYQRFQEAAERLQARPWLDRDTFAREPVPPDPSARPVVSPVDAFGLLELYYDLLRSRPEEPKEYEIISEPLSFADCARTVLDALGLPGSTAELGVLLRNLSSRPARVLGFLAILEMARLQWLDLTQERPLGPVTVLAVSGPQSDLTVLGDTEVVEDG